MKPSSLRLTFSSLCNTFYYCYFFYICKWFYIFDTSILLSLCNLDMKWKWFEKQLYKGSKVTINTGYIMFNWCVLCVANHSIFKKVPCQVHVGIKEIRSYIYFIIKIKIKELIIKVKKFDQTKLVYMIA